MAQRPLDRRDGAVEQRRQPDGRVVTEWLAGAEEPAVAAADRQQQVGPDLAEPRVGIDVDEAVDGRARGGRVDHGEPQLHASIVGRTRLRLDRVVHRPATDALPAHASGTISGAPSRALSAVWSSGCSCDRRSACTRAT